MRRLVLLGFAMGLVACGSGSDTSAPETRREARAQFTEFTVSGLELWRIRASARNESWSKVIGIDSHGRTVAGVALIRRATTPQMDAATLARRVTPILGLPGTILRSPTDAHSGAAAQRALVTAPSLSNETLTVWMDLGGSSQLERVQISLPNGEVRRESAAGLVTAQVENTGVPDPSVH